MINDIQEGQFTPSNSPDQETETGWDKIGDKVGMYAAAALITFIGSFFLSIGASVLPMIKFTFVNILKTWAGIWGIMILKGAIQTKII